MKQLFRKTKGLVKGMPSAVLISALIHLGLLAVAGGLVVFTVIKKPPVTFTPPPPVDRPKMDLKKPRPKVKAAARPRTTQRIATKSLQSMPDIALPDVSGVGAGLSGGVGGYELVPDVSGMSVMGSTTSTSVGNDFVGTMYSTRYDRTGKDIGGDAESFFEVLRAFVRDDWNPRVFAPYYRAPQTLFTTHLFILPIKLAFIPKMFGGPDNKDWAAVQIAVHYKGQIMSKTGGRYRFRGDSDGNFVIRVNKKIVFEDDWVGNGSYAEGHISGWVSDDDDNMRYGVGRFLATIGEWFELKPNEPVPLEALLGNSGGLGSWVATIEKEGEDYPIKPDGGPVLPAFRTAQFPPAMREEIEYKMYRYDADLVGGELFNVY